MVPVPVGVFLCGRVYAQTKSRNCTISLMTSSVRTGMDYAKFLKLRSAIHSHLLCSFFSSFLAQMNSFLATFTWNVSNIQRPKKFNCSKKLKSRSRKSNKEKRQHRNAAAPATPSFQESVCRIRLDSQRSFVSVESTDDVNGDEQRVELRMSHMTNHDDEAMAAADKEMEERANRAKQLLSQRYKGLKTDQVSFSFAQIRATHFAAYHTLN